MPFAAAHPASIPASVWVALGLTVAIAVGMAYYSVLRARSRARGRTTPSRSISSRGKGLTPQQAAFQEEMRVMLQARMLTREAERERPEGPSGGPPPADIV